ncbi:MAG TPA: FAD-binding oxidoreductase [Frankiaceae bacterium]|nr:FAD-binding oxidoreductase [Frankiaceae bacterium]
MPGVLNDVRRTASDVRHAARDFFTEPVGRLTLGGYRARIEQMRVQLAGLLPDQPVRLRKATSNLFRPRAENRGTLDTTGLSGVLSIDTEARTADVLGMTTYEDLVAATLPHGLMPLVVPQLKTITLGGAVTGLGIESTSFRSGCPHESVLEMDILTGDGRILTVTPHNEHAALFYGFPNSYGTLGYALRIRIELEAVQPYVHVRHLPFDDLAEATEALQRIALTGEHDGERVDFLDGSWFPIRDAGVAETYLTLGSYASSLPDRVTPSDYTGQRIYYRSIQASGDSDATIGSGDDWMTIAQYLWRWDTDWFWCSRAFGAQNPRIRRVWPARWRRSNVYWRIVGLERKYRVKARMDAVKGLPEREEVVQDIEVPAARVPEFLRFLHEQTGIEPVWLCPLKQRDPEAVWDLYAFQPDALYVNIGFWSTAPLPPGESDGYHNRRIEEKVAELGGRKSLYSTAFYPPEEFWSLYGGAQYEVLKKTYDPSGRLLDLYAKTVGRS